LDAAKGSFYEISPIFGKNYRRLRDDYRRRAQNKILKQRWAGKSDRPPVAQANGPSGLDRCEIHYMNLKHREDRRAEVQSEFKALGVTRFEAIAAADLFRPHKRSFRPAAAVFFRHRKKSSRLRVITRL
jgi:hypothetical protein